MTFDLITYWSSVSHQHHNTKVPTVSGRHRKAFNCFQSYLTGSSWIQLIHLIKGYPIQIRENINTTTINQHSGIGTHHSGETLEFSLKGNSVNPVNFINHWIMNRSQFNYPLCCLCLACSVTTSWSHRQEVVNPNEPFLQNNYHWIQLIQWKHWGKTQLKAWRRVIQV